MAMVVPLAGAAQPLPLTAAHYGSAAAPSAVGHPGALPLQQGTTGGAAIVAAAAVPAQLVAATAPSQPGPATVLGAEQPPVVYDAPLSGIADGEGQSGSRLDLSMELGDIVKDMKIADCEQQLYQRVA